MPTKSNIQRRSTLGPNSARADSASPTESSHTGPTPHLMNRILQSVAVWALPGVALAATACVWEQPTPIVVTTSVDPILPTVIPTPVPDPDVDEGRLLRLTRTYDSERNPSYSPSGDKIAFECYDDGWLWNQPRSMHHIPGNIGKVRNWPISSYDFISNICVMNADGSGRAHLTDAQGDDVDPAWSPDGNGIIFSSCREGSCDIYVMNADGSGLKRVTDSEYHEEHPTWSPDGSKIAFATWRDGSSDIYVINADGSGLTKIIDRLGEHGGYYFEPAWSPDGNQIAFAGSWSSSTGRSYSGIFVSNSDGTGEAQLFGIYGSAGSPAWSPDSKTIAFTSKERDGSSDGSELYIVNVDGSGLERLTYRSGNNGSPTWSPVGRKLAFVSSIQGNPEIYVLVDFRTRLQRLTDNRFADITPNWSPDGARIAFVSNRNGDYEVYIMNADGSGVTQLTDDIRASNYGPAWSPDGSQVAYQSDDHETDGGHYDIFVINEDGSENVKLTSHDVIAIYRLNRALSWSPDGARIAYVSDLGGRYQVHIMNSDGTNQVRLNIEDCRSSAVAEGFEPHWTHDDAGLAWSPDGTMLALACLDSNLRLIDPSDGTHTSFYACNDPVSAPEWSPDGTRIAFTCPHLESIKNDIHAYDISDEDATRSTIGREPQWWLSPYATRVLIESGDDVQPSWSPDGTKIAFASNRDGDYEIYVLDLGRAP